MRRDVRFIGVTLALLVWFASAPLTANAETLRIVGFGDSLMAGFELPPEDAFPVKLEAALNTLGYDVVVENAGVSGDTASAGLARLDWAVTEGTHGVIVEFGGNDALRGIDPQVTEQALDAMLARFEERGIPVLFTGMLAPPNLGEDYEQAFNALYPRLAETYAPVFYPFFLDGVAGEPSLNLADGIHPNADGVEVIVANILPYAEALIARIEDAR
ncbi:MAG: arylesterase [Pseudomonadota bacterium]